MSFYEEPPSDEPQYGLVNEFSAMPLPPVPRAMTATVYGDDMTYDTASLEQPQYYYGDGQDSRSMGGPDMSYNIQPGNLVNYGDTPQVNYGDLPGGYGDAPAPPRQRKGYNAMEGLSGGQDLQPVLLPNYDDPSAPQGRPAMAPAAGHMMGAMPVRQARSAEEAAIIHERWYFADVDRSQAEAMLRPENDGCFLIRAHKQFLDSFVLSVRVQDGFSHLEITPKRGQSLGGKPKTFFVLGAFSETFPSVQELITYHRSHKIEIVGKPHVTLRDPEKIYN